MREFYRSVLRPGALVFDIGANVGVFVSRICFARCQGGGFGTQRGLCATYPISLREQAD